MKILITGGSGLVGKQLTKSLQAQNIEVTWLSRTKGVKDGIKSFLWDYKKGYIEEEAFDGITHIVHLAGAGVFDKRWTKSYKKEIFDSRILTTKLLVEKALKLNGLEAFISGSAIGIYGNSMNSVPLTETALYGNDYLAQVTKEWEAATVPLENSSIRLAIIRTGIVLSEHGGALPAMINPIKAYIGSPLASGEQIISWIHIDDLCTIFSKAITDAAIKGTYNGVAPEPVTNKVLTQTAAAILHKPLVMPNVPSFALNILLGKEKAASVVEGIAVSAEKISATGFTFTYPDIKKALSDLL
jgi:uncharacterized protein (TIGR01777 family)